MNCKSLLVLFAASAVSLSATAASIPGLALPAGGAGDEATEAAIRRALLSQVASEEEVAKALSFMPDVVAEVNGTKITKQQIVDLLLSKKISQQVLALTTESLLRTYMQQYVDQQIDTEILKQKAKAAGFVPSEKLVKDHFDISIKKLPSEVSEALKDQLKERGLTLEQYRDEIAKEADIQANASIAAYEEKNFIEKAEKAVTDDAAEKFYRENQQKFAIPENITVAHILIQCAEASPLDSKEEKEIKAKADKLAKEQIDEIYAELSKNPDSFDKLAQEKSNCPSGKRDNGKLPAFDKNGATIDGAGQLDPDFAAAAYKIEKPGDFTKPVHTQFGYHIIKLLKKDPKGYLEFEKVKNEIRDFLVDKTVSEEIQAMIKDERAKGNIKVYDFTPAKADTKAIKNPGAAPTTAPII